MRTENTYYIESIIIDLRKRSSPSKMRSYMKLRDIKGIGPKNLESLIDMGINSLEKLREVDIEKIDQKCGIRKEKLIEFQNRAKKP